MQQIQNYIDQSGFATALRLDKTLGLGLIHPAMAVLAIVGASSFFLSVVLLNNTYLGWAVVFLGLFLLLLVYRLFLTFLLRGQTFTIEEVKAAIEAQALGRGLSFPAVKLLANSSRGDSLLLLSFFTNLIKEEKFLWVLKRLAITREAFWEKIRTTYHPDDRTLLAGVLLASWQKALGANHLRVRFPDLLVALLELEPKFEKILFDFEAKEEDLMQVLYWQRRLELEHERARKFWLEQNLLNTKGIGKDWSGGFSVNLDKHALDLTESEKIHRAPLHLYGRRNQVDLLERMLVRSGSASNVVLVGPPGVGRHTLLRAFAARVNSGMTFGPLRYMRLLQIDSGAILAGTSSLNDVVEKINLLFGEAYAAQNVILVVNDIDAFLDPQTEAGRLNATEALLPFLQSRLHIIGITTPFGYPSTIGKNPQLERLIGKLEVREATLGETLMILQDEVLAIERQSKLFFSHGALQEIVKLADRLIQTLPNPEKSLEILEETAVYAASQGERLVSPVHVQKVVTARTKVPVEKVAGQEKELLLNLESVLQERIVGQAEAIREISDALRRARSGIRSEKRPIGSFLFLGPTGVGKTETTKALASIYFGSEKRMIRFDMSEFQEIHSINRLIGDADTRSGGLLTEAVIASPFSLILLDEIEKAHPKILDLFLQVFDEGHLTDALGRRVSFTNTLIIATSNAGAELVREMVRQGRNPQAARDELLNALQTQGLFRPEFLNRFDAVIIFRSLSTDELVQVATLLLRELNERLAEKDIQIKITPELAGAIVQGGYSSEFGARPLRRFIQEHIENYVAKGLISGELHRGQIVEISPEVLK